MGRQRVTVNRLRLALQGHDTMAAVDGRHLRHLRDLTANHIADLGGETNISHAEKVLVGRAGILTLLIETLEEKFVREHMKARLEDLDSYQRSVNCLRRLFETLGLQRRPKPVPTLEQYLSQRATEVEDAEAIK